MAQHAMAACHMLRNALHGVGRSGDELFGTGGMSSSGSMQAMERNVARLFSERGPIFGEIEFTQNSILAGAPSCSAIEQLLFVGQPRRSFHCKRDAIHQYI